MKNFYKLAVIFLALIATEFSFAADTLEVFALRVQFAEETPDNSLTTGTGLFDSDKSKNSNYKLDPSGKRNSVPYWKKHFEFANEYFKKNSNQKLVIKSRIFPEASSAYKLKKQIIDYNRTSKMDGEKTAEFDEARSRDYLQFVYDAIMAAHNSGESPFDIPLSKNPDTKRAFMIIHAGASRLVDGGSMGTRGADTPADFMDVFIEGDYWNYLPDTLKNLAVEKVSKDSLNKTGIILNGDTLKSIMVMSETASQDGLNWGVNGIMVNQIGRSLGLPNTYDVVKGISRLGYYDMMDFAGYNAGNGFLPSMISAWGRSYMGWANVKEVRPVAGKPIKVEVAAAGSGLGTEIIKVPLSGSEYLLIENRARSLDGLVSVTLGDPDESNDTLIKTLAVDSLNYVFEDSICTNGKCQPNKKKASGIILNVSSFDAGLPASGIVVWRVNDWYLRETLQYGVANFWGGDTLRDHQFGISMVESDGVLSIGKTFKNAIGEDSYDYGAGTDLLPHLRVPSKNSKDKFDTIKTIGSSGYANTATTQGGYTGIKISVEIPEKYRSEKTANSFMGDSVINFVAPIMTVTISIDDGSIEGSKFPRNIGFESANRGMVFVENPEKENEKILVVASSNGTLQAFDALGDTLFMADTSVYQKALTLKDSLNEIPLYRLSKNYGELISVASDGKCIYSLHQNNGKGFLVKTKIASGMIFETEALPIDNPVVGPMVVGENVWVASKTAIKSAKVLDGKFTYSDSVDVLKALEKAPFENAAITDLAYGDNKIFAIFNGGNWLSFEIDNISTSLKFSEKVSQKNEIFKMALTDFNRDGKLEIVTLGSKGLVNAFDLEGKKIWSKIYKRGENGTSGLKDETSALAIGDVNDDGYPEIVFLGDNLVYALDRFGLPLNGFPIKISRGSPVFGFFSDPILVDVTGDDIPEILVPTNDGLVYAYNGKGKAVKDMFPLSAGSFEYADSLQQLKPMSLFVNNAVKKSKGPELYALHRNHLTGFKLRNAKENAAESFASWLLPGGSDKRQNYFDASLLKDVESKKAKDEISEFFMYPNPVKGGIAKARFEILAKAKSATLELYDITGLCVYKIKMDDVVLGRNQFENLDLKNLGSDVYTAKLKVKFESGKTKQKMYRVGVIR